MKTTRPGTGRGPYFQSVQNALFIGVFLLAGCAAQEGAAVPADSSEVRTRMSPVIPGVCIRVRLLPGWHFVPGKELVFSPQGDASVWGAVEVHRSKPSQTIAEVARELLEDYQDQRPRSCFSELQLIGEDSFFVEKSDTGQYWYRQYLRRGDVIYEIIFYGPTQEAVGVFWQEIRQMMSRIDCWRE